MWIGQCMSFAGFVFQSLSCVWLWSHGLYHTTLLCPPLSPGVCSNSCPLIWWCHLTISSSATPSPFAFNLSQHQGLCQWVCSLHQVAKVLELELQQESFQWMNLQGWFSLGLAGLISLLFKGLSSVFSKKKKRVFSSTTIWSISSLALSLLYSPTLTSVYDYWKNCSFDYTDLC